MCFVHPKSIIIEIDNVEFLNSKWSLMLMNADIILDTKILPQMTVLQHLQNGCIDCTHNLTRKTKTTGECFRGNGVEVVKRPHLVGGPHVFHRTMILCKLEWAPDLHFC